jgi:hypothetical protein
MFQTLLQTIVQKWRINWQNKNITWRSNENNSKDCRRASEKAREEINRRDKTNITWLFKMLLDYPFKLFVVFLGLSRCSLTWTSLVITKKALINLIYVQSRTQGFFLLPRLDGQRKRPWLRLVCFNYYSLVEREWSEKFIISSWRAKALSK